MNDYLIEIHNVPHEIAMYVEELKLYGDITRYSESFPLWVWISSPWDKDILEGVMGVKQVKERLYRQQNTNSVLKQIMEERGIQ